MRILLRVVRSGLASKPPKLSPPDQLKFHARLTTAERTLAAIIEGGPNRVDLVATITKDDIDVMLAASRAALRGVDKLPRSPQRDYGRKMLDNIATQLAIAFAAVGGEVS